MQPFHYSNAAISSHNTRRWLFCPFKDNQWKLSQKTYAMTLPADGTVFFFGTDSPLSVHCFDCSSSQVWSDGHIFRPWLWIDEKTRLYCCETSPNTRLQHPHDAVFTIVSKRGSHLAHSILMSKFLVNMRCKSLFEMPTMSASWCTFRRRSSDTIVDFLHYFWRGLLIWSTTAMFVLADRTASFNFCHPMFYCF